MSRLRTPALWPKRMRQALIEVRSKIEDKAEAVEEIKPEFCHLSRPTVEFPDRRWSVSPSVVGSQTRGVCAVESYVSARARRSDDRGRRGSRVPPQRLVFLVEPPAFQPLPRGR